MLMFFKQWCTVLLILTVFSISPVTYSDPVSSSDNAAAYPYPVKAHIQTKKYTPGSENEWELIKALTGGSPTLFQGNNDTLFTKTHSGRLHSTTEGGPWLTAENYPSSLPIDSIAEVAGGNVFFATALATDLRFDAHRVVTSFDKVTWTKTDLVSLDRRITLCEHKGTVWAGIGSIATESEPNLLRYNPASKKWDPVNSAETMKIGIGGLASNGDTLVVMDHMGHLLFTNDEGLSWHKPANTPKVKGAMLPTIKGSASLFFYYETYDDTFYANWYTLWVSNNGKDWLPVLTVPLENHIADVTADDDGTVYVATAKFGVYKSKASFLENTIPERKEMAINYQAYPMYHFFIHKHRHPSIQPRKSDYYFFQNTTHPITAAPELQKSFIAPSPIRPPLQGDTESLQNFFTRFGHWQVINDQLPPGTNKLTYFAGRVWASNFQGKLSSYDDIHNYWSLEHQLNDLVVDRVARSNGYVYLAISASQLYKGDEDGSWHYLTYPLRDPDREIIFDFGVQGDMVFLLNNSGAGENIKDILYLSTDGGESRRRIVLPDEPYGKTVIRKYGNYFVMGTESGIFYCDNDQLQSWHQSKLVGKLAGEDMSQVRVYHLIAAENLVIASSNLKLLVSRDNGLTWDSYNDGLEGVGYTGHLSYCNDNLFCSVSPDTSSSFPVMFWRNLSDPHGQWVDISQGLTFSSNLITWVLATNLSYNMAFVTQYDPYIEDVRPYGGVYGFQQGRWTNNTGAGLPSTHPMFAEILGNRLIVPTQDIGVYSLQLPKSGQ